MAISTDPVDWYQDQVIFLTGATGSLGGCLLYKLAVQLPTAKIFVLCRGSVRQAMDKWEASMPEQVDDIFDTGKVHCLIGDIIQPNLGLEEKEINALQQEVTVVIHAAANFSLFSRASGDHKPKLFSSTIVGAQIALLPKYQGPPACIDHRHTKLPVSMFRAQEARKYHFR